MYSAVEKRFASKRRRVPGFFSPGAGLNPSRGLEQEDKRGMLAELEDKRGKLRQESLAFKDRRSQLNAEASKWAAKRNELNKATKDLIDKAQELKKLRDDNNKNVAEAKKQRDEYNENTNQLYARIDDIRKKYNLTGERSIRDLRREIDHLEFRQQTEVLSPDKEKQLVDKIAALHAEFRSRKEQLEKNDELRKLLDEAQAMRDQASGHHDEVTRFAELAQQYHDQMILLSHSRTLLLRHGVRTLGCSSPALHPVASSAHHSSPAALCGSGTQHARRRSYQPAVSLLRAQDLSLRNSNGRFATQISY